MKRAEYNVRVGVMHTMEIYNTVTWIQMGCSRKQDLEGREHLH